VEVIVEAGFRAEVLAGETEVTDYGRGETRPSSGSNLRRPEFIILRRPDNLRRAEFIILNYIGGKQGRLRYTINVRGSESVISEFKEQFLHSKNNYSPRPFQQSFSEEFSVHCPYSL